MILREKMYRSKEPLEDLNQLLKVDETAAKKE
jgi:hypothetical protein